MIVHLFIRMKSRSPRIFFFAHRPAIGGFNSLHLQASSSSSSAAAAAASSSLVAWRQEYVICDRSRVRLGIPVVPSCARFTSPIFRTRHREKQNFIFCIPIMIRLRRWRMFVFARKFGGRKSAEISQRNNHEWSLPPPQHISRPFYFFAIPSWV